MIYSPVLKLTTPGCDFRGRGQSTFKEGLYCMYDNIFRMNLIYNALEK